MNGPGTELANSGGEYQARLVRLWERNLGVPVRSEDDYFAKGGDSLRGTQLLSWIQEGFGVDLSLLDLFESRTVIDQARLLVARLGAGVAVSTRPSTEYRFFGPPGGQLFGALHSPARGPRRRGVVLCYPMGQEYMRIHRTYFELARRLASSGHHVLRFDYHGCGDSNGETTAGSLERWTEDIRMAVAELLRSSEAEAVYLVGARIGANLALRVASGGGVAGVILWEPILNGAAYLATLQRAHRELLVGNARLDGYPQSRQPGVCAELVGFPIARKLYDEVAAIDLLARVAEEGAMPPALVVANSSKPELEQYVGARRNGGHTPELVAVQESDAIWLKEDRQNKGVIPVLAVQAIVSWIAERAQ